MALSISKALNIENEERGLVFLLLTQSVFLGIFAGALDVGANALFLEAYSANLMPRAFMVSGAVGIFFTSFYTFLQKRLPFKLFTILNLVVAILVTGALRVGYSLSDDPRLAFALLVMMGPVIIISMLGFWGTAGRYFSLRDGKRLFGVIDTGSIIGMVLAFYAVPVLVQFKFKVYDTLLIGLCSLIIALLFQVIVLQKHKFLTLRMTREKRKKGSGFLSTFKNRYTSLMAVFVVLSVITAFFVHYSFMWATEANYSNSRELTGFLGAFFGTMMIFTVVLKSTLYGWLMKNYGLRVTLVIAPALLLILTVIASLVGGLFGFTAEAASFTLFFLLIALSKLFNKSLKDSIESPSMKILYQSLDSSERFDVQARIDGVVNELTAFTAGLIMAGLLLLSFISVIHFSYILIGLLVIWVIVGFSLNRSYRKTLNDSLANVKSASGKSDLPGPDLSGELNAAPMFSESITLDPYFYHSSGKEDIWRLLNDPDELRKKLAWKFIVTTLYICPENKVEEILKSLSNEELKSIISNYAKRLNLPGKRIDEAFRANDKNQVLSALVQTVTEKDISQVPHLITLLRDRDMQLRAAAIEAAGELKVRELGSYLVDYIGHPELYIVTWSALVKMGEIILENLENAFYKAGAEPVVQLRIVRAMAAIGGNKANEYLFGKINHHQRDIREAAIWGLYTNDFSPAEKSMPALKSAIYEVALAGARNKAAESMIRENDPENGLHEAIIEEQKRMDTLLFTLLGITYDKSAIEHVQRSLLDAENEDTGFALELLNLIVDEEVYAYLEPYFDDISLAEKIRRLQNEMPVEILPYHKLLTDLLNRDSLYTGNYIRVCAIDAIGKTEEIESAQYLAAQVFHPNPVISRTASLVLSQKDAKFHNNVIERLRLLSDKPDNDHPYFLPVKHEGILQLVANLKEWEIFCMVDREVLFNFVSQFVNKDNLAADDSKNVSLIRLSSADDTLLSRGIVLNLNNYPLILEQIHYLASQPGYSFFQIDRSVFIELMFDMPEIHDACTSLFFSNETEKLYELQLK